MAKKQAEVMTNEPEQVDTPVVVVLKVQDLKPKQKALNLETMQEDEIPVLSKKWSLPEYNEKEHKSPEAFTSAALDAARELVGSAEEQIAAFLAYAASRSYQEGKAAAFPSDKYLTKEVADKVTAIIRGDAKFAQNTKSEILDRWKKALLAGKPAAIRILEMAQETTDFDLGV